MARRGYPGRATSRRKREGERGLVGARGRHSGRAHGAVLCARQREVGEDTVNDGRVVDGSDQLHPGGAARTAQDLSPRAIMPVKPGAMIQIDADRYPPRQVADRCVAQWNTFLVEHGFTTETTDYP